MSYTVDEVKEERALLEEGVLKIVNRFEEATGMLVENISFQEMRRLDKPNPIKVKACTTVLLPEN